MILQAEYHASFIRLRRVYFAKGEILAYGSDILFEFLAKGEIFKKSVIRYASFMANKISLKP